MAIYHFSAKVIGRSSGHSSVAAAAYRAGVKLHDERTGTTHDYTRKKRVEPGEILAPENAPAFALDRATLWNAVEKTETRKDAQLAREIEFSLPMELRAPHQKRMAREFVRRHFVDRGMVADLAFHNIGQHNPHCHVLLTMRPLTAEGFGGKERAWNAPALLVQWREAWAKHANAELARGNHEARIDHRTLAAQHAEAQAKGDRLGAALLDRPAQIHVGHTHSPERAEANATIQETALVRVALATLKEQERTEQAGNAAWEKFQSWQVSHERRVERVEKWRRVHPRLFAVFNAFGQMPKALKKLIEDRDHAANAVRDLGAASERADLQTKRARDLANLLEARREAAKHGGPIQIPPNPAPKAPEQAPATPASATPEQARKRRFGQ